MHRFQATARSPPARGSDAGRGAAAGRAAAGSRPAAAPGAGAPGAPPVRRRSGTVAEAATATRWTIDASHSTVEFAVRHMMISTVKGHFGKIEGYLEAPDITDLSKGAKL
ncbi:MAG TPA: YceI family protein, partial [Thermaerobacter sp.]